MFEIKKATLNELSIIYNLTKNAFITYNEQLINGEAPAMTETKNEIIKDLINNHVFLAYYNKKPAASIRLGRINENNFRIFRLGVLSRYREFNIGQKLIANAELKARQQGGKYMHLKTAYQIKSLIEYYQKIGYKIKTINHKKDYKRVLMVKNIKYNHFTKTII